MSIHISSEPSIRWRLANVIATELVMNSADITDNINLAFDLGVYSMDWAKLVIAIEGEFDISIKPEEVLPSIFIFQNLLALVKRKLPQP